MSRKSGRYTSGCDAFTRCLNLSHCRIHVGTERGYENLGFTKVDLYNYLSRRKLDMIKDGDARSSLSFLQGKADNGGMFFSRYNTVDDGSLKNLFWADGRSIMDFSVLR